MMGGIFDKIRLKNNGDLKALDLESVSHLLGFGGFFKNLFLPGTQALDAGVVDFCEDAVHLGLEVVLGGHLLFPMPGSNLELELVTPGLRKNVNSSRRHARQMSCVAAGICPLG
jgi:hypothetical protein